jgi:pleckstrin family protein A (phosphoinositide binding specific) protein 8
MAIEKRLQQERAEAAAEAAAVTAAEAALLAEQKAAAAAEVKRKAEEEHKRLLRRTPADFGVTFFAGLSCAWAKVGLTMADGSAEIPIPEFIAACHELSNIYDCLGSFLSPAKKDMVSILALLEAGSFNGADTVQGIVRADMAAKRCYRDNKNRKGLSFNLLWLSRALRFILTLLCNIDRKNAAFSDKECSDCARDAYGRTIKPYHGWMMSGVFSTMMGQVPRRESFIRDLALQDGREGQAYEELAQFVVLLEPLVMSLHQFFLDSDLNDDWKA